MPPYARVGRPTFAAGCRCAHGALGAPMAGGPAVVAPLSAQRVMQTRLALLDEAGHPQGERRVVFGCWVLTRRQEKGTVAWPSRHSLTSPCRALHAIMSAMAAIFPKCAGPTT